VRPSAAHWLHAAPTSRRKPRQSRAEWPESRPKTAAARVCSQKFSRRLPFLRTAAAARGSTSVGRTQGLLRSNRPGHPFRALGARLLGTSVLPLGATPAQRSSSRSCPALIGPLPVPMLESAVEIDGRFQNWGFSWSGGSGEPWDGRGLRSFALVSTCR